MRRGILGALLVVVWAAGGLTLAAVPENTGGTFRLLARNADGWSFTVHAVPRPVSKVQLPGGEYTIFSGEPQERGGAPGSPYLPSEQLSIGVPFDVDVVADLQNPVYEDVQGVLVAPTPAYRMTEEHEAVSEYALDSRAYSRDAFLPGNTLIVDPPFVLRQQRICTIHLAPYQYNPAQKTLRRLISGTLHVRYAQSPTTARAHPGGSQETDPQFEEVYRSLIANYDEARMWRANTRATNPQPVDTTGTWFETGRQYLRIPVAKDGWYVVSKQQLSSAGISMNSFGENDARLFLRGQSVPFLWRPDTSIEFYGLRRQGDSTAYDFYSDTSMYWLTFQGPGSGSPIRIAAEVQGAPTTSFSSARVVRHFEQNTDYYEGTGDAEVTQNGPVAGEGWVWSYFYPNTTTTFPFSIDHLSSVGADSAVVTVKLYSTTLNYNIPDHIARFWVNDSLAGEVQFTGRKRGLFHAAVPAAWLKEGSNVLKITSVATPSVPNQFYLDWFEVEYTRDLFAGDGTLLFAGRAGTGVASYAVSGLPDSVIEVVDLGSLRRITGGVITGSDATGYTVAFVDSLGSHHRYAVVAQGGRMPASGIRGKEFIDLRHRPDGADYVIVTHRLFRTVAQSLATHRAAQNGVRTLVVDVDDLYDEFGFGFKSAEAIKAFLSYAYAHWAAPALSSVLFFGDASWDPHFFMSSSVKTDFVPAYGVPAGDNWFGCFDPVYPFLSSLIIGRIPVADTVQARRMVDKVIGFDTPVLADWNKNFIFITGGNGPVEQSTFTALTEPLINTHVVAPPIGGTAYRIYKKTDDVINGEWKNEMRALFKSGLSFVNFLGHSGGGFWNVDIGDPNELENTNGMLPFVASTSCNVSAFAEPSSNVLSENFVLADNRAAIAMWGASSLGYANSGTRLVNHMLTAVSKDSVRRFGVATSIARYKLWQESGSGYITLGMVNLNPLLGDPLNELPIPLQPDIAISQNDLSLNTESPSPLDTALVFRTVVHQYGLLPEDSVTASIVDAYNGSSHPVVSGFRFRATGHSDTLAFPWPAARQPGQHHLTLTLDPDGAIAEVTKANNTVVYDQYVYADVVLPVRPLECMLVPPGPQRLRVTSPLGSENTGYNYTFELDTSATFGSGYKVTSDLVTPGAVFGEWVTPDLIPGHVYYWRARTVSSGIYGTWVSGSFRTQIGVQTGDIITVAIEAPGQFSRGSLRQLTTSDSGVSLIRHAPVHLYARSLGSRTDWLVDKYSIIAVNEQIVRGYWWVIGNSFLVLRLNEFTGEIAVRGFDLAARAVQADSMRQYIRNTPTGSYLAIIVIFDGKTNVTDSLYAAIESLGSTQIRSVVPGQSWALISHKGYPAETLEDLTNDSAVVALDVPNVFSIGNGTWRSPVIPAPVHMDSLRWGSSTIPGKTQVTLHILGRTTAGSLDTLRTIPAESTHVSLAGMDPLFANLKYSGFALEASLSTSDAAYTPLLQSIALTMGPPADLAITPQTIGSPQKDPPGGGDLGLPVTVHNIGYRAADSARVTLSLVDPNLDRYPVLGTGTVGALPVDGLRQIVLGFSSAGLTGLRSLEVHVTPATGGRDLVVENNTATVTIDFTSLQEPLQATMQVYADGVQLMDGDYVSNQPQLLVRLVNLSGVPPGQERVAVFVDGIPIQPDGAVTAQSIDKKVSSSSDLPYAPELKDGIHDVTVRVYRLNGAAGTDSLQRRISINVLSETRILKLFNYPNPFADQTAFTFVLTGQRPPDDLTIRIFTITGRKIREITVPPGMVQVGFNSIPWDGRDSEGDEIANGYYFYQLQTRSDGKIVSGIEKLVKMR